MSAFPESTTLWVNIVLAAIAVCLITFAISTLVNAISEGAAHFKLKSDLRSLERRVEELEERSDEN